MGAMQAVAAMSLNRVIGRNNTIPWHIPADFKWFKELTMGHILVMGRKTFESIGKALPGRTIFVLTRQKLQIPNAMSIASLADLGQHLSIEDPRKIFICGGAQLYEQTLGLCTDIYLTVVKKEVQGDAFMPPFEHLFPYVEEIRSEDEFKILHYSKNRELT